MVFAASAVAEARPAVTAFRRSEHSRRISELDAAVSTSVASQPGVDIDRAALEIDEDRPASVVSEGEVRVGEPRGHGVGASEHDPGSDTSWLAIQTVPLSPSGERVVPIR